MEGKNLAMTWILGIALAGMIAGFVNLGVEVFNPAPKYEDFCTPEIVNKEPIERNYPMECDVEYQKTMEAYNQQVFWVLAPIGFALVVAGIFLSHMLFVTLVGIFGGSFLVIESIIRNLNSKVTAFITLGLIILLIGFFAYKKIINKASKEEKNNGLG